MIRYLSLHRLYRHISEDGPLHSGTISLADRKAKELENVIGAHKARLAATKEHRLNAGDAKEIQDKIDRLSSHGRNLIVASHMLRSHDMSHSGRHCDDCNKIAKSVGDTVKAVHAEDPYGQHKFISGPEYRKISKGPQASQSRTAHKSITDPFEKHVRCRHHQENLSRK